MHNGNRKQNSAIKVGTLQAAYQCYLDGSFENAAQICEQMLAVNSNQAPVLSLLGAINLQLGSANTAVQRFQKAVELEPHQAVYHLNLGEAYRRLGEAALARTHLERAVLLAPQLAETHYNLGLAYVDIGCLAKAAAEFEQAININPRIDRDATFGDVLRRMGDYARARSYFELALANSPKNPLIHAQFGALLHDIGRVPDAIQCYEQALKLDSGCALAHANLGMALKSVQRPDKGILHLQRAIELDQRLPSAHTNLGSALLALGRIDEALQALRRGLEVQPNSQVLHSNLLFAMPYHPDINARTQYLEAIEWGRRYADPLTAVRLSSKSNPEPNRRLRIGYVSSAFCDHVEAHVTIPLFRHFDHNSFEVICYSAVKTPTRETELFRGYADDWCDISRMTDREAAQRIEQDGIDILVNLAMHGAGADRALIFAYKPAPIQACWLAYPGTTGLRMIDYRFTDRYLDPPGTDLSLYSEESLMLPDSFWCYDPLVLEPDVNALPALARGHITFGCLNKFAKINEATLGLWAQLFANLPSSRLLLVTPPGERRRFVLSLMESKGVAPTRIKFVFGLSRAQYRSTYNEFDIGLDPFPYNGGITTLDAIWMGVPVVTLLGQTVVGRAGHSIAMNLGLPELVAHNTQEYIEIAACLARDLPRLMELRANLRPMIERSPLMNGPLFAGSFERLYRHMWHIFCRNQG
jgi:predicted O-linked N-acetylglucosamine transferase (SPINDLY family)